MSKSMENRFVARSSDNSPFSRLCAPLLRKQPREECCFTPTSELRRPDPAIYSQTEIIRRDGINANVTWMNPDIELYAGTPARLMPEATITVHNRSSAVSAAGARADVYAYRFGIGYPRELIGGSQLSIPAAGQTRFMAPLPQRIVLGEQRVGIELRLTHATDLNTGNNIGLHACQVIHTSSVGRNFNVVIPIRNSLSSAQEIYLRPLFATTDLMISFTPTAGPFNPLEERMVVMGVNAQALAAGPSVKRELHFTTVAREPGGELRTLDEGVSFLINIDA